MNTTTQPTPRSSSPAPAWTPGPWRVIKPESWDEGQMPIVAKTGFRVCWANPYASSFDDNRAAANARLISLAPDMAELLKQAHVYVAGEAPGHELDQAIRALLARINGNT